MWISVEDKLPNTGEMVVLSCWSCGENFGLVKGYYNTDWFLDKDSVEVFGDSSIDVGFPVTHWMPLPKRPTKPPKGD